MTAKTITANVAFSFALLEALAERSAERNVFVSPLSVGLALGMAYNGAKGETQKAIARALRMEDLSSDEINAAHAAMRETLAREEQDILLRIANSLWLRQDAAIRPEFIELGKRHYAAEVRNVDFGNPGTAQAINGWVKDKTAGKIPQIIGKLDPAAMLVLANAIYFKGRWSRTFNIRHTEERPFHLADGRRKQHPLMRQTGKFAYYEGDRVQVVRLPYGEGRSSMIVVLPEARWNARALVGELTAPVKNGGAGQQWARWLSRLDWTEGTLMLPRFTLEYEATLNSALASLGMGIAFEWGRANFEGIAPPPPALAIDQVRHKTFVEVNEESTEAAAATVGTVVAVSMWSPPRKTFTMVVDRPFLCAIRDDATGTLLFLGVVDEPK